MELHTNKLKAGKDYFVLSTVYDAKTNGAGIKLFDVENEKFIYITDTYGHKPYCYSDKPIQEVQAIDFPARTVTRIETVTKKNLLKDADDKLTQIFTQTPSEVPKVREIVGETWESRIKYHRNWIYDIQIVPGRRYWWDPDKKIFIPSESASLGMTIPHKVISHLSKYEGLYEVFCDDFTQEIPDLPIVSCDIETEYIKGQIPQATDPKFPIICICFSDNKKNEFALVLKRGGIEKGNNSYELSPDIKIEPFEDEKELLKRAFEIINRYPIVVTFNGDNFDFPYLHERAKHLKVGKSSPIKWNRRDKSCDLKFGLHIDIYRFYHNVAIRSYAFGNRYREENLNAIAQALLGIGKISLSQEISELSLTDLINYCARDAKITLDLLLFDDKTPLNLIFILARVSRTPIDNLVRTSVSGWVRSLFYYEHRRRHYFIPNPEDIQREKGEQSSSKAIIKGKKFKGARVIEPIPGVHFNVAVLDFASLYPSIIETFNLSYETILCHHDECKQNRVPQTNYWVCQKNRGIVADVVGFIKDVRVKWLKPESKKETPHKQYFQILERSLKVLINACLPYDEEIIVKHKKSGVVSNRKIGSLEKDWHDFDVLSINRGENQFGAPIFVPIKNFSERKMNRVLTFTLSDGRSFRCTSNHYIPRVSSAPMSKRSWSHINSIDEVPAGNLKIGEEVLVLHKIPLSESPLDYLFIPDYIDNHSFWIGIRRDEYKQFSYRVNEETSDSFIKIINTKFQYSKSSKMYKIEWKSLSSEEKQIIKNENRISVFLKIYINVGKWYPVHIPLNDDFFLLLGWYVADGSASKNRISISQSKKVHPIFWNEIRELLDRLDLSYYPSERGFTVHSNVFSILLEVLCGRGAINKKVPIFLMNLDRARIFLESYFKGDGSWDKYQGKKINSNKEDIFNSPILPLIKRKFSTISPQLRNSILILLGAIGKYASVQKDLHPSGFQKNIRYRIIETEGRHYKRKTHGLFDYNGSTPVKIKKITNSCENQLVYDITTGNGWFISTNGVVVHNSYGVLGSDRFSLYCLPVADSTTAYGRDAIERTIQKAQSLTIRVLYGDTDSVFLYNPTQAQIDEIIKWSQDDLGVGLEMEKIYRYVVLSERKKNYFGVYPDSSVDVKGLMGKKRNTPQFLQEGFNQVLGILSKVNTNKEFDEAKQEIKNLVRTIYQKLEKNSYTGDELAITMQLTQPLHKYRVRSQHVKAAQQLEKLYQKQYTSSSNREKRDHTFIKAGQLIRFIKTQTADRVTPLELFTSKVKIDVKAYKSMIDSIFDQLLGALDIDVEEVASGQVNLMEFFS